MGVTGALLSLPCCSGDALVKKEGKVGNLQGVVGFRLLQGSWELFFFPVECNNHNCDLALQNTKLPNPTQKNPVWEHDPKMNVHKQFAIN